MPLFKNTGLRLLIAGEFQLIFLRLKNGSFSSAGRGVSCPHVPPKSDAVSLLHPVPFHLLPASLALVFHITSSSSPIACYLHLPGARLPLLPCVERNPAEITAEPANAFFKNAFSQLKSRHLSIMITPPLPSPPLPSLRPHRHASRTELGLL